jgi:pimeloyl-ACP methyl ester carboxylesterase
MPIDNDLYYTVSDIASNSNTPIILIHGAGSSSLGWHASLRRMPGRRMIAIDLTGHGKSAGAGKQSIADYARDIIDFINILALTRVILVGHSMGGAIALQAALLAPKRISGLIIVSSGAVCNLPEEIVNSLSNPTLRKTAINWLCDRLGTPDGDSKWVEQTRKVLMDTRQGILYGDLYACSHYNLEEECREIRVPTLICCGRQDRFFPPAYSHQLAELIPGAKEVMLDGGHLLPLENPQELAEAIQDFLKINKE